MTQEKKYAYLQFPLCLLGETYKDPERGLNLIISYGIMNYALKMKYDLMDVAKQALYDFERNREKLQPYLVKSMTEAIEDGVILYEDNNPGFDAKGNFNPEPDLCLNPLVKLLEEDSRMRDEAILNYQLHLGTSKDHLRINIKSNSNIKSQWEEASKIKQAFEQRFGPDAMPIIKKDLAYSFRDQQLHDLDLFRAYIGIRSIIGRRNFAATYKPAILSRMIGCKNKAAFEAFSQEPHLRPTIERYGKRYQMDHLLHTLRDRGFIMYLSPGRRSSFYISKFMPPEDLAKLIKQSRNRYGMRERIRQAAATI